MGESKIALLVEDDEDDFFIVSTYFQQFRSSSFHIIHSQNLSEAKEAILMEPLSIIILDYYLVLEEGLDLVKWMQSNNISIPVILLTGADSFELDSDALEMGILDFLVKSQINAEILERSIRYSLKQYETTQSLKTSEEKYRLMIEHSQDLILILNKKWCIESINHLSAKYLLKSEKEIIGESIWTFFKAEGKPPELQDVDTAFSIPVELIPNTTVRFANFSGTISKGKIFATIHDTTLEKFTVDLRLQNERLESNSRLIRSLAHEIRNPLSSIVLATESLSMEPSDFLFAKELIGRNTERIHDIINKVLSGLDQNPLNKTNLKLQDLLEKAFFAVSDRLQWNNIQFNLPEINFHFAGFEDTLILAFTNLFVNSIEALKDTPQAKIKVFWESPVLQIEDNGKGISKEELSKINLGLRVEKGRARGVGLSVTRKILESHKISMQHQNANSAGTMVILNFAKCLSIASE